MLRKRDYSSVYQPRIPEPTGDRPLGNSIGALPGYTFWMTKPLNICVGESPSELSGVTQKQVDAVIAAFSDVVVDTLADNRDDKVTLGNLGTFKVKHVPERSGVAALAGGKEWTKPAHDEICFKMSKSTKELA